jgi:UDP-4-amino-4,6-dideoxy-N-acetyl-beta-L-altrosamine N-acetyltransferase
LDWIINADDEDVGLVSLTSINRTNRRCDWAYYLGSPNVRGKGIGKSVELNVLAFVFETLALNKLCCEVFVSNQKVISIHEKFGSVVEGTRREQIHKNGEFHDIVEMGILRNDWERNVKGAFEYTAARIEPLGKEAVDEQIHV